MCIRKVFEEGWPQQSPKIVTNYNLTFYSTHIISKVIEL